MPISFEPRVNKRVLGEELSIVDELHVIPATAPYVIKLIEVPLEELPSSVDTTVNLVPFNETTTNVLTGEFKVDYSIGTVTFHSTAAGGTARVSYKGRGSIVAAEDVNELQDALESVFNEVETARGTELNLDTRLDVSLNENGTLVDGIVTPSKISTSITDDFTFPNDVTINGDLNVIGSSTMVVNETVQNDLTVTDELIVNGNSSLGNQNTDTTTVKGEVIIDSSLGTGIQFNQKEAKQLVIEVMAGNPGSPVQGQIWFDTTVSQWKGYNGTSIVIIG